MPQPLVSVVIPTFNRARYVCEAVESVLAQTHPAIQLIVVDDGSTDDTARALLEFAGRIAYLKQENRGIGAARNAGIAVARGDFFAFLDDDDLWMPDKLERQLAVFQNTPDTDAVYGCAEQFLSPELDEAARARLRHLADRVLQTPTASLLLIRRQTFERVGLFDEALRVAVEMDWYARFCELGLKSTMLDAVIYRRRLHGSNFNLTHASEQSERLLVLKKALDRRRKLTPATV